MMNVTPFLGEAQMQYMQESLSTLDYKIKPSEERPLVNIHIVNIWSSPAKLKSLILQEISTKSPYNAHYN